MINWFQNYSWVLHQYLLLLQDFSQSCNHIAHHVCVMHDGVLNGKVGCLSYFLMCHPKKQFEYKPCLQECCHAILLKNLQSELARTLNSHISDIHGLRMYVGSPGDVGELEEFFDSGEYGHNQVLWMVGHLLDDVFVLKSTD